MVGKYNTNHLQQFGRILRYAIETAIHENYDNDNCTEVDAITKLILLNNGCAFADKSYQKIYNTDNDSVAVLCIYGAQGNAANTIYDVIEFNGLNYLVCFMDNFKDMGKTSEATDEISRIADEFMQYSQYFDYICTLVNKFIALTSNNSLLQNGMAATAAANNYRYAPLIIAGSIVSQYHELTENDVYGIELDYLNDLIKNYNLSLYGIRVKE
jgi:hypothetical protein